MSTEKRLNGGSFCQSMALTEGILVLWGLEIYKTTHIF